MGVRRHSRLDSACSIPQTAGNHIRTVSGHATVCLAYTSISMGLAVAVSGATPRDAAMVTVMVLAQSALGAGIWLLIRSSTRVRLGELVGMSLVLGPLAVVTLGLVAARTGLILPAWSIWLGLIIGNAATWGVVFRRIQAEIDLDHALNDYLLVAIATPLALVNLLPHWIQVSLPANIISWGTLSGDAAVDEARANSLATLGPADYLLAAGHPLKYHLLANAWAGFSQSSIHAAPYVVTTRVLPLVAIVATLLLAWTWIRGMSGTSRPAWWAVALVVVGGPLSMQAVIFPGSTSEMWSSALCLALMLVWWLRTTRPRALIPAATWLGAGMGLAKSNSLIYFPALLSAAAVLPRRSTEKCSQLWATALGAVAAAGLIGLYVIGYGNGLTINLTESLGYLRLADLHAASWAMAAGGAAGAVLLVLPWLGIINVRSSDGNFRLDVAAFSLVLGLAGVATAIGSAQWGKSQFYSIAIAGVALIPLSAWGLHHGWSDIKGRGIGWMAACIGAVAVITPIWILPMADDHPYRLIAWTLGVAATVATAAAVAARRPSSRALIFVTVISCVAATSAFCGAALRDVTTFVDRLSPVSVTASSANSISRQHLNAIEALAAQNLSRELVATNFLCNEPLELPPECLSIQFPVAAIGSQRMLLEGYSYAVGHTLPPWAIERAVTMDEFSRSPSRESAERLWEWGVRWAFVDLRRTDIRQWEPFATATFSNRDAVVLRLRPPAAY